MPQHHASPSAAWDRSGQCPDHLAAFARWVFRRKQMRKDNPMGVGWIAFLFIGLIAGWIAEKIMNRDQGLLMNLLVGVVGAYLGAFIFSLFGLGARGFWGALVVAIVGAVVLLWIVGLFQGRRTG